LTAFRIGRGRSLGGAIAFPHAPARTTTAATAHTVVLAILGLAAFGIRGGRLLIGGQQFFRIVRLVVALAAPRLFG
jgi:hypothetical protein